MQIIATAPTARHKIYSILNDFVFQCDLTRKNATGK
jgi:hypothetical protein